MSLVVPYRQNKIVASNESTGIYISFSKPPNLNFRIYQFIPLNYKRVDNTKKMCIISPKLMRTLLVKQKLF